jgi:hypothetical protein
VVSILDASGHEGYDGCVYIENVYRTMINDGVVEREITLSRGDQQVSSLPPLLFL